jgi:hypothetical protein
MATTIDERRSTALLLQFGQGDRPPVEHIPDDTRPAIRMRLLLERDKRDYGDTLTFAEAFDSNLELCVRGLPSHRAAEWRQALTDTRDAWERAYSGSRVARSCLESQSC